MKALLWTLRYLIALVGMIAFASSAWAGPPFLTDDPEPTEPGHWEIYGPLIAAEGSGADFAGTTGIEINYGAADNVQITLGLPVAYAHDPVGWQWGSGDLAVSAKYRFYRDEDAGLQIAAFPGVTIPTARNGMGGGKVTGLLPIWVQKDSGNWSIFGGGGYHINPGAGNRDYWSGGAAVTRHLGDRLMLGLEADRQGADSVNGQGSTSLGIGGILRLNAAFRVLASGGPTFADGGGKAGFHFYVALGRDY